MMFLEQAQNYAKAKVVLLASLLVAVLAWAR